MDRRQLPIMANTFPSVFDPSTRNDQGDQRAFCQRQRLITPCRFGLSVVASMASQQVQSIADVPRDFNALWNLEVSDKACSNQLAKPRCRALLRTSLCAILGKVTLKVLGFQEGAALRAFDQMVMQDGRAFAIHDALRQVFPGRFSAVKPAAVALHCTMALLHDAPLTIVFSPDTDAEPVSLPAPESLKGRVFLADRGDLHWTSLSDVAHQDGCFVVRAKEALHPLVIDASREDGQPLKGCRERDVHAIVATLPKRQRVTLIVEWWVEGQPFRLRLIVIWHKKTPCFLSRLTHRPEERYDIDTGCLIYTRRWHVAFLLKQWKSSANLPAFDTTNEDIAEALIWASLAAAAVKRFLAHATEHLLEVVISTHKAAMSRASLFPELFRALCHGEGPWLRRAFEALIRSLGGNAKRAHPRRDERTGRSRLGRKSIFELTDNTELTETYEDRKAA